MRIGIDARAAVRITDGIGRYAVELLGAYAKRKDSHEYLVLKHPELEYSFKHDARFREIAMPANRFSLREQFILPGLLRKLDLDIFHSLHFTIPVRYKGVQILTLHDIMPFVLPWFFGDAGLRSRVVSSYLKTLVKVGLKRAAMIIVVSDYSARDLVHHLGVDGNRVRRIYHGSEHVSRVITQGKFDAVSEYGLSSPYLVTITNFRPYKNLPRLLEAFQIARRHSPDLSLVVVGKNPKYASKTLTDGVRAYTENVRFLEFLSDDRLVGVLRSAEALVFPSLYEGFGFPVLEAMTLGVPVITSKAASLPELAGDAAFYVDPTDTDDIANAIVRICADSKLRQQLGQRGLLRSARFQWDTAAEQTLRVYEEAVTQSQVN